MKVKCNEQTRQVSLGLLVLYVVYGLFRLPVVQYGVSLAVGVVVFAVTGMIEYSVVGVLAASLVLPLAVSPATEGFVSAPTEAPAEAEEQPHTKTPVTGAADSSVEDVEPDSSTFTGSSTPASAETTESVKKLSEKNVPPANQPAELLKDGFEDQSGLFKLGKIPTDEKGGYHIDAGTSVLNALKSLKPDQISAMTQDTKQLIETQKTLMNMLQSFKPMLTEGKDMMDTFQQMFSPSGGSAMGALQAAQDTLKK
jgi:hypothetical protein